MSKGVLRRTPLNPRSLRVSESRFARSFSQMNYAPHVALALAVLCACRPASAARAPAPPVASYRWARQTLARMTLEEKAAQMIGVRAFGLHYHPASEEGRRLRHDVRDLGVGSIVVFESEVDSLPCRMGTFGVVARNVIV